MDARFPIHGVTAPDPTVARALAGDLPPEEYRAWLHRVADWTADYRERIESLPISPPDLSPGALLSRLPPEAPERGEELGVIFRDFEQLVLPDLVHWGHPAFLGYFGSTTTAPGVLAEILAAALNVGAFAWRVSPAATELELLVLRWLREMLGLPPVFEGVVYDSASVGIVHALAAAREAAGYDVRRGGLCGRADVPRLVVYASDQAHSSIDKAAIVLGLGEASVCRVPSDASYAMDLEELRRAIDADERAGHRPLAVVATVGTTSTAAVDPVPPISALCRERGIWLHVDAAYGGAMALLPEGRWVMEGVDGADSVIVNPHKWLFVPFDFSALYTRRPGLLREVFTLVPEYLLGDYEGSERNYMDYGLQLGRRFRALKAWVVWRALGRQGLADRIREHCRLARLFASWVEADPALELMAPVAMSVVCFRSPGRRSGTGSSIGALAANSGLDELNRRLVERVNATGEVYLTRTELRGRVAVRLAVCNELTAERHLARVHDIVRREVAELVGSDVGC